VAVEWPGTRVVGVDLKNHVSVALEELHITTLGVEGVDNGFSVPFTNAFVENEHVVSMEMDRVSCANQVVEDNPNRGVRAKVIDVPLWVIRVGVVSYVGEEKNGIIVVGSER